MKGKELTDMEALRAQGAAGFTDDGVPIMDVKLLMKAMETAKKLDVPLSFHEEDPGFIINNGINRGAVSEALGIGGSPRVAEDSLVARDCMIALYTGACVNIQHISSKNAVAAVALAKKLGADVWAEVTPHHLTLDETAVLEFGSLAKMNPPLRTKEDREALIAALCASQQRGEGEASDRSAQRHYRPGDLSVSVRDGAGEKRTSFLCGAV